MLSASPSAELTMPGIAPKLPEAVALIALARPPAFTAIADRFSLPPERMGAASTGDDRHTAMTISLRGTFISKDFKELVSDEWRRR